MSIIRVIDVVKRVEDITQDSNIRWPRTELQQWLNDSYLAIIALRPDANNISGVFTCVAGTRQKLITVFPSGIKVVGVVRNMAAGSNKNSVRQINREILDDQRPGWHAETGVINIQHWMFDPLVPKEFLVYPPALATSQLEILYSDAPVSHALSEVQLDPEGSQADVIKLDDIYLSSIIDYILYRAYQKDAEYADNQGRSLAAYNAFIAGLTGKTQSDMATTPTPKSNAT